MPDQSPLRRGLGAALIACVIWGLLPLYFRALHGVPAPEVVANRIVWSLILLLAILAWRRSLPELWAVLRQPRLLLTLVASALFIGVNWLVYIWAVQHGHVLAGSLGYFLNPLISVMLGALVLGERLGRLQWLAVAVAGCGVALLGLQAFDALWISLALAFSFGFYGLIRKMAPVGPLVGLTVETLVLGPIALGFMAYWQARGQLAFTVAPPSLMALLVAAGPLTTIPLMLYAFAAQRLRLSTLGLTQYIGPTLQLGLGLLVFHEPLTPAHSVAFPLIWAGLALYSWSAWQQSRPATQRPA